MKNIVVLGSKGMLGQMVSLFFVNKGYKVLSFDEKFTELNFNEYLQNLNSLEDSIIFNCIGKIKQKTNESFDLIWSNSILPLALAKNLKESHFLILPSTDCVFDGLNTGLYEKNHAQNAKDMYGFSKSIGEFGVLNRNNVLVIRVSIIGPDVYSNKGLLSWFLSIPQGEIVKGFTNHYWNGITTLEWCTIVDKILCDPSKLESVKKMKILQLGSETLYTKYQMLCLFNEVFGTNHVIVPSEEQVSINRCLVPEIISNDLKSQLRQLKSFWNKPS